MRWTLHVLSIALVCLALAVPSAQARRTGSDFRFKVDPPRASLPADLQSLVPRVSAAVDTVVLASWDFETFNPQGFTHRDPRSAIPVATHVADAMELDGGDYGNLVPISGAQSLWCGAQPSNGAPLCSYFALPGYGNDWSQLFESVSLPVDTGDVTLSYTITWDSEPGYDETTVEYQKSNGDWQPLPVNGGLGRYYGVGVAHNESVVIPAATLSGTVKVRLRFESDAGWSDEDGLFTTDGAYILDDLMLADAGGTIDFQDFEAESPGDLATTDGHWSASIAPVFGDFSALYPGVLQTQEDPCVFNGSTVWAFIDDPLITAYLCHTPNPLPQQGAMPFGPRNGFYLNNEVWSPPFELTGQGNEILLTFDSYRDLPLDNLQFYWWKVRSIIDGCPGVPRNDNFVFYGGQRDWHPNTFEIQNYIDLQADAIQVMIGAVDFCNFWCGVFGTGACHSHAPLLDNVEVLRVNSFGPRYTVRHIDLFQDNFAEDGTVTGTARADIANDIASYYSTTILPGDTVTIDVDGGDVEMGIDPYTNLGTAVYMYVSVWPPNQVGKDAAGLQAPETRGPVGLRYPIVDSFAHDGNTWYCVRGDTAGTGGGSAWPIGKYCFDLNDQVLTPGDTVCYFFCATDSLGNTTYWTRTLNGQGRNLTTSSMDQALASPCEFTILPAGGWQNGGDILYVDDTDDRGGPSQLFFDSAFDLLGIKEQVDRYDVLGPSSVVNNSLASRVSSVQNQIVSCYRKIIWSSGNLASGTIGDGTGGSGPEKSADFGLLFHFLDTHPDNPGLYINGDNVAAEWVGLSGSGALNLRSIYMNFNLVDDDHVSAGEPLSPLLTAVGPCFVHLGVPDQLIAYGGCPAINSFDVLQATGSAATEFPYPNGSGAAVLSQATGNSAASVARVILSGFSFESIRDKDVGFPPARAEHLRDILIWLVNEINPPTAIIGAGSRDFLESAAPNPFNPSTRIRYGVRDRGHVSLRVYNVAGQLVRTLVNEVKSPREGGFAVSWDGTNDRGEAVSSGVYFYKLTTKGFTETRKMVLLK